MASLAPRSVMFSRNLASMLAATAPWSEHGYDAAFDQLDHALEAACGIAVPAPALTNREIGPHLRAFDHPNLFVVGSQVFPSITANTPTLTVAALSARLGAYLEREFA